MQIAEANAEAEANALGQQLREWVEDEGAHVHPALQLSTRSEYGRHAPKAHSFGLVLALVPPRTPHLDCSAAACM
jgi:hypothetical protein